MTTNTRDRIFIAILFFVLVLYFKSSCLNLPAFGDEANYLAGALAIYKHHLNPFTLFWAYKPPLFYFLAALLYKIFGYYSLAISRSVSLFSSFLTIYFTFLLAEKIYNKETGFWAAILLFFSPFFFAQSGMFYSDGLIATLTVSTIYFFLKEDKIKYLISGVFLVLTKETTSLTIIAIGIYKLILSLQNLAIPSQRGLFINRMRQSLLDVLFVLTPLTFLMIWMACNRLLFGWYIYPIWGGLLHHFSIDMNLIRYIYYASMEADFRYLLTLSIIGALILRRETLKKEIGLFLAIGVLSALGLAGLGFERPGYGFSPRYMFFFQPLFFIVGTASIIYLFKKRIFYLPVFFILGVLFIHSWTPIHQELNMDYYLDIVHLDRKTALFLENHSPSTRELNMDYLDIVRVDKEAALFLETHFSSTPIIATFPIFNENLAHKEFGYVDKNLPCYGYRQKYFNPAEVAKGTVFVTSKFWGEWNHDQVTIDNVVASRKLKPLISFTAGVEKISIFVQN